jgi:hypothetical protein
LAAQHGTSNLRFLIRVLGGIMTSNSRLKQQNPNSQRESKLRCNGGDAYE